MHDNSSDRIGAMTQPFIDGFESRFSTAGLAVSKSPLVSMNRLSSQLRRRVWIKRDDWGDFGLAGCKARKLNLILADALAGGAKTIVGCGPPTSNSCRALAAACAHLGLECHLFLRGDRPTQKKGNAALSAALGAKIHWVSDSPSWPELETRAKTWALQHGAYFLQPGGTEPLGVAAMVLAYLEFASQAQALGFKPSIIVHASASGGVSAGLRIGASLWERETGVSAPEIHSIAVVSDIYGDFMEERYEQIASDAAKFLGVSDWQELHLNKQFIGERYDKISPAARSACALFAKQEGLLMDGYYVGRAAAAFLTMVGKTSGDAVLWHTGGTQGLLDASMMNTIWEPVED